MRLIFFIIILSLVAIIPYGIWISIGIFFVWLLYKLRNLKGIQIEIVSQRKQNEYDAEILEEMK